MALKVFSLETPPPPPPQLQVQRTETRSLHPQNRFRDADGPLPTPMVVGRGWCPFSLAGGYVGFGSEVTVI